MGRSLKQAIAGIFTLGLVLLSQPVSGEVRVRQERPRVFLRASEWEGPNLGKIRQWFERPEYQARKGQLSSHYLGKALLYLITRDEEVGRDALAQLRTKKISGSSPSYSGLSAQVFAAAYDWLHDHPDMDEATRRKLVAHMEKWGDIFKDFCQKDSCELFYSRFSGAAAGLAAIGIALHGDSPKAQGYVDYAYRFLTENLGAQRQFEDGATAGGTYGTYHVFTDLANMVAAFEAGTDTNVAEFIREKQGDWLQRQLLWQIWATYPNGWFVKDGDLWRSQDNEQHRKQIDAVTSIYHNGFGRTWADQMSGRWGTRDYWSGYVWEFFAFNNPEVRSRPLAELGRAELFGKESHGHVFFREGWGPNDAHIFFKAGDGMDVHQTFNQGHFAIFKSAPLAIRGGIYAGKSSDHYPRYYSNVWSSNCIVFIDPDDPNDWGQQRTGRGGHANSLKKYLALKGKHDLEMGDITEFEVRDDYARAVADLAKSSRATKLLKWRRELVWLGYKYLIVLDEVETAKPTVRHKWLLHSVNQPKVLGGQVVQIDNAPGRLYVHTLLPRAAQISTVGGPGHEFDADGKNYPPGRAGKPGVRAGAWRLEVSSNDEGTRATYLHVLIPTEAKSSKLFNLSFSQAPGELRVTVGAVSYTFVRNK